MKTEIKVLKSCQIAGKLDKAVNQYFLAPVFTAFSKFS
jgi:hypothetical protein